MGNTTSRFSLAIQNGNGDEGSSVKEIVQALAVKEQSLEKIMESLTQSVRMESLALHKTETQARTDFHLKRKSIYLEKVNNIH